jgi:hypothetical protein
VGPGDVHHFGATTDHNGSSWLAATLPDGRSGYIWLGWAEPGSRRALYYAMIAVPLLAVVGGIALLVWKNPKKPDASPSTVQRQRLKCMVTATRGGKFGLNLQLIIRNDDRDLYDVRVTRLRLKGSRPGREEWVDALPSVQPIRPAWKKGETITLTTSQFDRSVMFDLEVEATEAKPVPGVINLQRVAFWASGPVEWQ